MSRVSAKHALLNFLKPVATTCTALLGLLSFRPCGFAG
jgi:hypothetical protein